MSKPTIPHSAQHRRLSNDPCEFGADPWLRPYLGEIARRRDYVSTRRRSICGDAGSLKAAVRWPERYGLHQENAGWRFREWLPNATSVALVGDFNDWTATPTYQLRREANGDWCGEFPLAAMAHGDQYRLAVTWPGGAGLRIPAGARRVVRSTQDLSRGDVLFNAQVWSPAEPYAWRHSSPRHAAPLIYEAHVGMAQERLGIGSFREFTTAILPRIVAAGYNTVQLMAVQQHPYYGSFGYHVANFFAVCDLFGTPEEFKELVDTAHGLGLRVIMDLVHSHAVRNEVEGIGRQDGSRWQYFHDGPRGEHPAWDSLCFDYSKDEVCKFLLGNCRFWLEEYRVDGFRFDGVTSMLYRDHGLGRNFSGYDGYFDANSDWEAFAYLALANELVHEIRPDAWTIAEDVSGMPGLAAPVAQGGCGFDYRLAMGVTDYWFKLSDQADEHWSMNGLWYELSNRRQDERTVSYLECHDQALVGGQSFIFKLIGKGMFDAMHCGSQDIGVDRGCALHKLARLITIASAAHGYLNFMGNEFGHPEWIDFPRTGNDWSFHHARRLWHLRDERTLRFHGLGEFDRAMLALCGRRPGFFACRPQLLKLDELAKIIVFERADLIFIFNFHPSRSQADYGFVCLPGRYRQVLDSDAPAFGGQGRLTADQCHDACELLSGDCRDHWLYVYVPSRVAIVLEKMADGK
ncbi:MAG: alpha-amylase family glycosyl hydrolase [Lentisphaeria bacterium]